MLLTVRRFVDLKKEKVKPSPNPHGSWNGRCSRQPESSSHPRTRNLIGPSSSPTETFKSAVTKPPNLLQLDLRLLLPLFFCVKPRPLQRCVSMLQTER